MASTALDRLVVAPPGSAAGVTAAGPGAMVGTRRVTIILVAMACSTFLVTLVEAMPTGLLTLMAHDLGSTTARLGLIVTAYAVVVVLFSVPLAAVTVRIPRRWVLGACIALIAAATAVGALASTFGVLLGARMATAFAQALFWVAVLPGTTGLFPAPVRGRVMGRLAIGNALAPLLGLPAATWLGSLISWRASFLVVSALCVIVLALVLVLFPTFAPAHGGAARAPRPHRTRFAMQLAQTALVVTGAFGMVTFVTAFLTEHTGFAQGRSPGCCSPRAPAVCSGCLSCPGSWTGSTTRR